MKAIKSGEISKGERNKGIRVIAFLTTDYATLGQCITHNSSCRRLCSAPGRVPTLHRALIKDYLGSQSKGILIGRLSVAFFAIGSQVISLAPVVLLTALGIVIFALGSGFAPATRSLATTLIHQHGPGLLYSALAMAQTVGGLVAGSVLGLSFRWSFRLER